jgi:hypothetical protein
LFPQNVTRNIGFGEQDGTGTQRTTSPLFAMLRPVSLEELCKLLLVIFFIFVGEETTMIIIDLHTGIKII